MRESGEYRNTMKQQQYSYVEHNFDDGDDIADRYQSSSSTRHNDCSSLKPVTSTSNTAFAQMNSRQYRLSTSIVIQLSEDANTAEDTNCCRRKTRASKSSSQVGDSIPETQQDTEMVVSTSKQHHTCKSEDSHAYLSAKRPTVNHSYRDHYHDPNLELLQLERQKQDDNTAFQKLTDDTDEQMNDDNIGSPTNTRTLRQRRVSTGSTSSFSPSTQRTRKVLLCPETEAIIQRTSRGGVTVAFPEKLYETLRTVEEEGQCDIVSWQPHGRCFLIHKKSSFVEQIIPRYVESHSKSNIFQLFHSSLIPRFLFAFSLI